MNAHYTISVQVTLERPDGSSERRKRDARIAAVDAVPHRLRVDASTIAGKLASEMSLRIPRAVP